MVKLILLLILSILCMKNTFAQQERPYIRKGVKDYTKSDYGNAEVNFRKALDENDKSFEAAFNTGNALYKQEKPDDAAEMFNELLKSETDKTRKSDLYYNLGNTHLKKQDFQKGIDAYRNALRLNPEDEDARYNLAYAMSMLQEQENQQENQDQENNEDSDEDKQDQQADQQNQENSKDNKENSSPQEREGISREEAEQILKALEDREKEVKEEVDKKRAKAVSVPGEKDW